jgi:hypothetical protein
MMGRGKGPVWWKANGNREGRRDLEAEKYRRENEKKKRKKGVIRISGALMTVIKQLQTRFERWDDAVVPAAAVSVGVTRPAVASPAVGLRGRHHW